MWSFFLSVNNGYPGLPVSLPSIQMFEFTEMMMLIFGDGAADCRAKKLVNSVRIGTGLDQRLGHLCSLEYVLMLKLFVGIRAHGLHRSEEHTSELQSLR